MIIRQDISGIQEGGIIFVDNYRFLNTFRKLPGGPNQRYFEKKSHTDPSICFLHCPDLCAERQFYSKYYLGMFSFSG